MTDEPDDQDSASRGQLQAGACSFYGRPKAARTPVLHLLAATGSLLNSVRGRASAGEGSRPLRRAVRAQRLMSRTVACARCGEIFVAQRSTARFCGAACRRAAHRIPADRPEPDSKADASYASAKAAPAKEQGGSFLSERTERTRARTIAEHKEQPRRRSARRAMLPRESQTSRGGGAR